jgi:hypothetical protein
MRSSSSWDVRLIILIEFSRSFEQYATYIFRVEEYAKQAARSSAYTLILKIEAVLS